MISRRSFLQVLLGAPAVAALPSIAQVVEALPVTEVVSLVESQATEPQAPSKVAYWLTLNGYEVDVVSMQERHEFDRVTFIQPNGAEVFAPGMLRRYFECEILLPDRRAPTLLTALELYEDEVEIRAMLGHYIFSADACMLRCSQSLPRFGTPTMTIEFMLLSASIGSA